MAKNRSALAKFAEAEKYAPNWGRLHLKWGDTLWYAGRRMKPARSYQTASTLELSTTDKAEMARTTGNSEAQR